MSDNENNNNNLMPEGGSSPPTDQVSQTDAPAVGSENNDTSSAEEKEEKPQGPSTDNDKDKDESQGQGQETEGGEESNKENKNDFSETAKKVGKSLTEKYNELLEAKKNDNKKDSLGDQMKDLNEVQVDKTFVSDSINLLGKISFDELIGNPLRAAVKAQRDLAKETLSYIREEGIKVDENGQGQITYVTMNFFRDGKQVKMRVPLLTLMPVPRLSISTMSYTFKAKVNAMSGVVASVGSGGTPINAGMSTDNGSKSAASAKPAKDSSSKGNNEKTGDEPAASTENSAASSNKNCCKCCWRKAYDIYDTDNVSRLLVEERLRRNSRFALQRGNNDGHQHHSQRRRDATRHRPTAWSTRRLDRSDRSEGNAASFGRSYIAREQLRSHICIIPQRQRRLRTNRRHLRAD